MQQQTRRIVQIGGSEEAHEELRKKGVYFLCGEVDDEMAYDFTMEMSIALVRGHLRGRPILIMLNTPGGSVEQGLAIYDSIRMLVMSGVEVQVLGIGLIASMGTVIMQAATRRLSMPNTQYLVHQLSMTIGYYKSEEVGQVKERASEMERLNNVVMGIIAERAGIDREKLKELCAKKDHWMDAATATELGRHGLIDEIVTIPQLFNEMLISAQR